MLGRLRFLVWRPAFCSLLSPSNPHQLLRQSIKSMMRTWAAITREQGTRLMALNLTTVEDLAAVPDSGLGSVGLDGRYLRDLARNVVESGKGVGAMEKKLADAEQRVRDQATTIENLSGRLSALEAKGKKAA